jgi:hypothetical protein
VFTPGATTREIIRWVCQNGAVDGVPVDANS